MKNGDRVRYVRRTGVFFPDWIFDQIVGKEGTIKEVRTHVGMEYWGHLLTVETDKGETTFWYEKEVELVVD